MSAENYHRGAILSKNRALLRRGASGRRPDRRIEKRREGDLSVPRLGLGSFERIRDSGTTLIYLPSADDIALILKAHI